MNPVEFADKYFGRSYIIKNDEIIPDICPFCHGGAHHDKKTFAMNIDSGVYNCKRGKCGANGSFSQLLIKFNEKKAFVYPVTTARKYKKPEIVPETPSEKMLKWFEGRGISPEVVNKYGIMAHDRAVCFRYYDENGELCANKFRTADKKFWFEKDNRRSFFGMQLCEHYDYLIITEGEIDCLSLSQAGIDNAVSLPNGSEGLDILEEFWAWLERFNKIYIWTDNDEPGIRCRESLIERLGRERCLYIESESKDANEALQNGGVDLVIKEFEKATYKNIEEIIRMVDDKQDNTEGKKRFYLNIPKIDTALNGFRVNEITILTGVNGSGKTTILSQLIIEAISQKFKAFIYSGEMAGGSLMKWMEQQFCNESDIITQTNERGVEWYTMRQETRQMIKNYYADSVYKFDDNADIDIENDIFKYFDMVYKRFGCDLFIIDNLMTAISNVGADLNQRQTSFVERACRFVKSHDAHIIIVGHPRKPDLTQTRLTVHDISGTSNSANLVFNILALHRVHETDKEKTWYKTLNCEADAVLEILKNRIEGEIGVIAPLEFKKNRRWYTQTGHRPKEINYKPEQQKLI